MTLLYFIVRHACFVCNLIYISCINCSKCNIHQPHILDRNNISIFLGDVCNYSNQNKNHFEKNEIHRSLIEGKNDLCIKYKISFHFSFFLLTLFLLLISYFLLQILSADFDIFELLVSFRWNR